VRALRYQPRRAKGSWPANVAVLVLGAGLLFMGLGGHPVPRWSPPPAPPASVANANAGQATPRRHGPRPLGWSAPVTLTVPAIGVTAHVIPLGVHDGEISVPPLTEPFLAGWYDRGPAPGQPGAAVLLGHVDAAGVGPAVFYRLGDLRQGDRIFVTRTDGRTAVFTVTGVGLYSQRAFPARRVYTGTSTPTLRLITCGGEFDWQTHLYLDRTVVFATYAGSH
jgi:Sortase domain